MEAELEIYIVCPLRSNLWTVQEMVQALLLRIKVRVLLLLEETVMDGLIGLQERMNSLVKMRQGCRESGHNAIELICIRYLSSSFFSRRNMTKGTQGVVGYDKLAFVGICCYGSFRKGVEISTRRSSWCLYRVRGIARWLEITQQKDVMARRLTG